MLEVKDMIMSTTFTLQLPRELKEKMDKNPQDWSKEIRDFLQERIKQIELNHTIQDIESRAEKRKTKTDSTTLIKKDRER
jgi:hypothetical protein